MQHLQSSGRSKTVTTEEKFQELHEIIMDSRPLKLCEIDNELQICMERIDPIVRDVLNMSKLSARWVPRLLRADQKLIRLRASKAGLEWIHHDPKNFWRCIVTIDETWVHHYVPESKAAVSMTKLHELCYEIIELHHIRQVCLLFFTAQRTFCGNDSAPTRKS